MEWSKVLCGLCCVILAVLRNTYAHECEVGNPLLNSRGEEICCGSHCAKRESCPESTHECYINPSDTDSWCCQHYEPVPREKVCHVPSRCRVCRPSEQLMVFDGKGCPACTCTSLTPCRYKTCGDHQVCTMVSPCDDPDDCEPEPKCSDICQMPLDIGNCDDFHLRWYFDSTDGVCKKFNYGGCNGNSNNFETKSDCLNACGSTNISPINTDTGDDSSDSQDSQIEEEKEPPVGCPLISCPSCLVPYALSTFTNAATNCQDCRCHLAITDCQDMPCEDDQKCVMTDPPICEEARCAEIPTCVALAPPPKIEPESDETKEDDRPNDTEREKESKEIETETETRNEQHRINSCPTLECSACAEGLVSVYDTKGCLTCGCVEDTCGSNAENCVENDKVCRMMQPHCFRAPCNPIAGCFANGLCSMMPCDLTCDTSLKVTIDANGCSSCYCTEANGASPLLVSLFIVSMATIAHML